MEKTCDTGKLHKCLKDLRANEKAPAENLACVRARRTLETLNVVDGDGNKKNATVLKRTLEIA